jgi:hypothetical protein
MPKVTDLPGSRAAIAWGLWCLVFMVLLCVAEIGG